MVKFLFSVHIITEAIDRAEPGRSQDGARAGEVDLPARLSDLAHRRHWL